LQHSVSTGTEGVHVAVLECPAYASAWYFCLFLFCLRLFSLLMHTRLRQELTSLREKMRTTSSLGLDWTGHNQSRSQFLLKRLSSLTYPLAHALSSSIPSSIASSLPSSPDLLTHSLLCSSTHPLTLFRRPSLPASFPACFHPSFLPSLPLLLRSLVQSLTHSFTHSLTYIPTRSLTHTDTKRHPLTQCLFH